MSESNPYTPPRQEYRRESTPKLGIRSRPRRLLLYLLLCFPVALGLSVAVEYLVYERLWTPLDTILLRPLLISLIVGCAALFEDRRVGFLKAVGISVGCFLMASLIAGFISSEFGLHEQRTYFRDPYAIWRAAIAWTAYLALLAIAYGVLRATREETTPASTK